MADTNKLKCIVVTPETTVLDASAEFVVLPGFDGEVGVLPRRAPLVVRLGAGELRLKTAGSEQPKRLFVDGGFGQVRGDVVTILTPRAKEIDALRKDRDAIAKQLDEATATSAVTPAAMTEKETRVSSLRAQLRLADRKVASPI
ncbi:MAG: ATP synthase F1 subunit epsilon [Planctomycetia bacterium]